ncbi:protein kinase domain-containing protein, partial [Cellulomonas hominis]|nr:serine/threonine protein kinase [Cellulomonas hominis]
MTRAREASQPPHLPGYAVQRLLGSGGSADVFLYEQELPRRAVAVKVLLASVDAAGREAFEREADLTARLSHHPSIVTVFQAGVARDGRPFLVMEYCSRPGLGQRYRTERFGVPEVLQLGVRLASAVETAHRAGILHRDIKPGNVLTNDFGRPVLSDFGIAATVDAGGPAVGMSIPWAAPELLAAQPHGDARSDVYSLAATLFSALAGRSPFERPGGSNEAADLVGRIERGTPVAIARGDLPERLTTVLARAMARDPQQRHPRAVDLAHDLRAVEADLGLPLTPLDVPDVPGEPAGSGAGPSAEPDATRVRTVHEVAPVPRTSVPAGTPVDVGAGAESTRLRPVVTVPATSA